MNRIPRTLAALCLPVLCAFATVPVYGCQEAGLDPMAVILAPETQGALELHQDLPSLPSLAHQAGVGDRMVGILERWEESWDVGLDEGRALRRSAYSAAIEPVVGSLELSSLEAAFRQIQSAVELAQIAWQVEGTPDLGQAVDSAQVASARGLAALEEGNLAEALRFALESADFLRETSPRTVATNLVVRAESALGRIVSDDSYPEETLARARRLSRGARRALTEGDLPRAIRRAFYACQLLGVDRP